MENNMQMSKFSGTESSMVRLWKLTRCFAKANKVFCQSLQGVLPKLTRCFAKAYKVFCQSLQGVLPKLTRCFAKAYKVFCHSSANFPDFPLQLKWSSPTRWCPSPSRGTHPQRSATPALAPSCAPPSAPPSVSGDPPSTWRTGTTGGRGPLPSPRPHHPRTDPRLLTGLSTANQWWGRFLSLPSPFFPLFTQEETQDCSQSGTQPINGKRDFFLFPPPPSEREDPSCHPAPSPKNRLKTAHWVEHSQSMVREISFSPPPPLRERTPPVTLPPSPKNRLKTAHGVEHSQSMVRKISFSPPPPLLSPRPHHPRTD